MKRQRHPLETSELEAFVRTVESRSMSRAAESLGTPRATLSRRLARLEKRLAVRLLRRTTRSLALTDAGEQFYAHAVRILSGLDDAERSVRRVDDVPRGTLRLSLPPVTSGPLLDLVADFVAAYPEVRVEAQFRATFEDLARGGVDVAIRASSSLAPGLIALPLARTRSRPYASPAYLAAHGTPRRVADLEKHRLLLGYARGEVAQREWPLVRGGTVPVRGALQTDAITLLVAAALRGSGIAMLSDTLVEEFVAAGLLVPVLDRWIGHDVRVSAIYVEREFMPAAQRVFLDILRRWVDAGGFANAARISNISIPTVLDAKTAAALGAEKTPPTTSKPSSVPSKPSPVSSKPSPVSSKPSTVSSKASSVPSNPSPVPSQSLGVTPPSLARGRRARDVAQSGSTSSQGAPSTSSKSASPRRVRSSR